MARRARRFAFFAPTLTSAAAMACAQVAYAVDGTWASATSGSWSDNSKWANNTIADNGGSAYFDGLDLSSNLTVHLDSARTVGAIAFGDFVPSHNWTLDDNGSGNMLTLAASTLYADISINNGKATFDLNIDAANPLEKTGAGTLLLSRSANHTTDTYIFQGAILAGVVNVLPNTPNLTVAAGATFNCNGFNQTLQSLTSGNSGTITNSGAGGGATLTLVDALNIDCSNRLNGALSLVKTGAGIFTLSTVANYSGSTRLMQGVLVSNISNALPSSTDLTVDSPATFDLADHNQTVRTAVGSGTITNTGVSSATLFTLAGTASYSTLVNLTGNLSLSKAGNNTVTLATPASYAGTTTVGPGTLAAGVDNALPTTTALRVTTGATFNLNGFNQTLAGLFSSANGTITNSSTTSAMLTVNNATASQSINLLSGNMSFTKNGAGLLTLSRAATYTGTTRIQQGTLMSGTNNVLTTTTPLTIDPAGTFDLNGFNQTLTIVPAGSGTFTNSSTGSSFFTIANAVSASTSTLITGNLSLIKLAAGSLTIATPATYTGSGSISFGTLVNGVVNALPTGNPLSIAGAATYDLHGFNQTLPGVLGTGLITNSSAGAATLTLNNAPGDNCSISISSNVSLAKTGPGTFTLSGALSYTGPTNIVAGKLVLSHDINFIGAVSGNVLIIDTSSWTTSDGVVTTEWDINGAATIRTNGSTSGVSKVTTLAIAGTNNGWTGLLDLTNNGLIVRANAGNKAATRATLQDQVDYGTSLGIGGITSSSINSNLTRLVVVDNAVTLLTSFRGVTGLDSNSLIVGVAHVGDTNLDGLVNSPDFVTMAANWNTLGGATWEQGDFIGGPGGIPDGKVTSPDFVAMAAFWDQNVAVALVPAALPQAGGGAGGAVPEPGSLAFVGLGGAVLLARRRRKGGGEKIGRSTDRGP